MGYLRLEIGSVAQWVSACVTTAAIIVALLKEDILRKFRRPELIIEIKATYPFCTKTPLEHGEWKGFRYFIRLWIRNEGNTRAEEVEVFLRNAYVVSEEGYLKLLPQFTPMNLRWSYGEYPRPTIYADGISPYMGRYCDLGAISEPSHPILRSLTYPDQTRLSIRSEALRPATEWLLPGKYRFDIVVAASNCDPVARQVELVLTGEWFDDQAEMFAMGFIIRMV